MCVLEKLWRASITGGSPDSCHAGVSPGRTRKSGKSWFVYTFQIVASPPVCVVFYPFHPGWQSEILLTPRKRCTESQAIAVPGLPNQKRAEGEGVDIQKRRKSWEELAEVPKRCPVWKIVPTMARGNQGRAAASCTHHPWGQVHSHSQPARGRQQDSADELNTVPGVLLASNLSHWCKAPREHPWHAVAN